MGSVIVTNIDIGNIVLERAEFRDDVFASTVTDSFASGTILARDSVSGKMVAYAPLGTNETNIPKGVLTYTLNTVDTTDSRVRFMVSGVLRADRLLVHTGEPVTKVMLDQLRDYSLIAMDFTELNIPDNQ